MTPIIKPVNSSLLAAELTPDKMLRRTNRGNHEIYVVSGYDSPHVMCEIGRLREVAFRNCGGGTGLSTDIDDFDLIPGLYSQLIVWSPQDEAILGGYRFACGRDVPFDYSGAPLLASSGLFDFSEKFVREILPQVLELGRSFVRCEYQSSRLGSKCLYVLDNLWDGLLTLTVDRPYLNYFFGKVTMYRQYNREARNLILYFLRHMFSYSDQLVRPKFPVSFDMDTAEMDGLFQAGNLKDNYRILNREVRNRGANIPPLFNAYMNLTSQMQTFGTALNAGFGDVEETAILIAVNEIAEEKKKRHLN